jgi:hypothetical protein
MLPNILDEYCAVLFVSWTARLRFPAGARTFHYPTASRSAPRPNYSCIQWMWGLFPVDKAAGT